MRDEGYHKGDILTLVAPYSVNSGEGFLVGMIFAVSTGAPGPNPITVGNPVEGVTRGVVTIAKTTGAAWTQGQALYWDNAAKKAIGTATGNKFIGYASQAAASADATGDVFIFPSKDVLG